MKNGGRIPWSVTVQDLLSDGKTPYERRFFESLKGPKIPFGSMVEYHPISAKDLSTSSARKSYLEYSSVMSCIQVESGR